MSVNGRFPDFFIVGAMRAGTTSLHHILDSHPGVFIPKQEIFFFDVDDFEEHAEQARRADGQWWFRDFEAELAHALAAYHAHFSPADGDQLIGEDSTTYLTSAQAPARIARLCPEAKIVISLRDPVARAWSHYWHLVRSGRAVLDFESTLISGRGTLLKRSIYPPALQRWFDHLPAEQIHVMIFEEFIASPQLHLDALCDFLGLSPRITHHELDPRVRHRHRAGSPGTPRWLLAANWLRRRAAHRPGLTGPVPSPTQRRRDPLHVSLVKRIARLGSSERYPPMNPQTQDFLERLLGRANAELPARLGRTPPWPCLER